MSNEPPNDRRYQGRPAVEGKPLELQTRDELLAYIRQREADLVARFEALKLLYAGNAPSYDRAIAIVRGGE